MTGRIVTARHGRPALSRDLMITGRQFGEWWAAYDRSGLHADERPPEGLKEIAARADFVFCSTLPRARETARQALGEAREAVAQEMFVEAPLPAPPIDFVKLRPGQWGVVSRTIWFVGFSPNVEGHREAWRRVSKAADFLTGAAQDGEVLLCAHGYFNWMLDFVLRGRGWRRLHNGGHNYWSWREYEKPK